MIYNIAICDDDTIQLDFLENLIIESEKEKDIEVNITKYLSGEDMLANSDIVNFHIIMLDMEMKEINGIEVARAIREINEEGIIIFITGYKDYVFNVFEVKAFRYLLKPLKKDVFVKAFSDAIETINMKVATSKNFLHIKRNKEDIIISYNNILYFEKYKNKVLIVTDKENIELYGTMNQLIQLLNMDKFIRVHQGYIANIDNIEVITSKQVLLKNGNRIPISRRNAKEVKESFLARMKV